MTLRPAYTLLEVLLATAIGVLLLAALYIALDVQFTSAQAGRDTIERTTLARSLLARMAVAAAFLTMPYARTHGLGTGLSDAPRAASVIALAMGVVACAAVGLRGIVALATVLVVSLWWRRACMRRIGGTTGDTAGALVELATINGAASLGLHAGRIEVGALADLISIDLDHTSLRGAQPAAILDSLIFGSGNGPVDQAWVSGKPVRHGR